MNDCGISKLDLKRRNRMQILRVIRERGPISRVDISNILHITRAAVTIITNEMIDQRILEEVGEEPLEPGAAVRKGRRKILLDINMTYRFSLGAYIDEHQISMGLTTLNAAALDKCILPISKETSMETILDMICQNAQRMLQNSCLTKEDVIGIGIGIMPSMWESMRVTIQDGKLVFEEVENILAGKCGFPAYAGNAISLFAATNVNFAERGGKQPVNQVFLYGGSIWQMAVVSHSTVSDEFQRYTQTVERMCVNPCGKQEDGYPDGSVHAELSEKAIRDAAMAVYSSIETPFLYHLTDGNPERITLANLLRAVENGDAALRDIVESIMAMFCMLMSNLSNSYFAQKIYLHHFGFDVHHLEQIRSYAVRFIGAQEAEKICLSTIEERYNFLSGCTYAINLGFYYRGGM